MTVDVGGISYSVDVETGNILGTTKEIVGYTDLVAKSMNKAESSASSFGSSMKKAGDDVSSSANSVDKYIVTLKRQLEQVGMTSDQISSYTQYMKGATYAQLDAISALQKEIAAKKNAIAADDARAAEIERSNAAINSHIDSLKFSAATMGMSKKEVDLYAASLKGATAAQLDEISATHDAISANQALIAAKREQVAKETAAAESVRNYITALQLEAQTLGLSAQQKELYIAAVNGATNAEVKEISALRQKIDAHNASVAAQSRGIAQFKQYGNAINNAAGSNRAFNGGVQQAGYQIQDLVVQLQNGTSAFVAIGQQGSQLAGAFGPGGAVIGAVIALGSALLGLAYNASQAKADLTELAAAGDRIASLRLDTLVKINDATRDFASSERIGRYKQLGNQVLELTTAYENQQLVTSRLREETQKAQDAQSEAGGFFGKSQAEATAELTKKNAELTESLKQEAAIRSQVNGLQKQMSELSSEEEKEKSKLEKTTTKAVKAQENINGVIADAKLKTQQLTDQYKSLGVAEDGSVTTKKRLTMESALLVAQQRLSSSASATQVEALAKEIYAQDQLAAKLDARITRQKKMDEALKKSVETAQSNRDLQSSVSPMAAVDNSYTDQFAALNEARAKDLISDQTYYEQRNALANGYEQARMDAAEQIYKSQSDMNAFIMNGIDALGQASTSTISGLLSGTMSVTEAMQNFANVILNQAVGALVNVGIEYIKNQVLAQSMQAATMATAAATGTAMAAAYAPAAAMASLASFGANAAPAAAGISSTVATSQALALTGMRQYGGPVSASGMYRVNEGGAPEIFQSGDGKQYLMPNSRGEVVSNSDATSGSGVQWQINVINNASDVVSTTQSVDNDQRIVNLAINAVASQLSSRTGQVSAGLQRGYSVSGKTR